LGAPQARAQVEKSVRQFEGEMDTEEILKLERKRHPIAATTCNLAGSTFTDVNLSGAKFHDVNFSGASLDDVNMSDWCVKNANLSRLRIRDADLRGASIAHSLTAGMTIDGISVADLMTAYHAANPKPK